MLLLNKVLIIIISSMVFQTMLVLKHTFLGKVSQVIVKIVHTLLHRSCQTIMKL